MRTTLLTAFLLAGALYAAPATIRGTVQDPAHAPIPAAQVSAVGPVGVLAQTRTNGEGRFELVYPEQAGVKVVITAQGFETKTVAAGPTLAIELQVAAVVDTVTVTGSAMDVPLSEQGSSVSIIPQAELRQRNEPIAADLLHYIPGIILAQNGPMGGADSVFIRGGDYNFNLVQIDGVPVNSFGGAFDFAHIPSAALSRVDVVRGPESAVYGAYANSGVINFITRTPEDSPTFDVLAEGGSHNERRFGLGTAFRLLGFGVTASVGRLDDDGPVENSAYRNEYATLKLDRTFGRQTIGFSGFFVEDQRGDPGAYGSDPEHLFGGIDTISHDKNNFSDYLFHYQADLSDHVREEAFGSFFLNNNGYTSPYGFSYNKDIRGDAEVRTIFNIKPWYTMAIGEAFSREEVKNTYITNASFNAYPIPRNYEGSYWENRFQFGPRWFVNAGVRLEVVQTPLIPSDGYSHPDFPAKDYVKANPKLSLAYVARPETRLHASFGTGFRPPAGFDLAFTTNPALKPERTISFDAGVEQRVLNGRLSLDATYFYNRYYDLIVALGGSLQKLSHFTTDNLSNSRAQGAEFSARLRTARWMLIEGWYTYMKSEILSLNGTSDVAPQYFAVGQELLRRPANSGAVVSTFTWRRIGANVTGFFRGSVLDSEPNYGASAGLFRNPGFANVGLNVNYHLDHGVTLYGNLRNALDRRYEEIYGYPAPLLNFITGVKWTLGKNK